MKDYPNTKSAIETNRAISNVKPIVYAEWNLNRYIDDAEIIVNDTIPDTAASEEMLLDARRIEKQFPVESMLRPYMSNTSAYVIAGTKYRTNPQYRTQASRSDESWQTDTTWLWYGNKSRFNYWTSSLKSSSTGALPHNVGKIFYTWSKSVPVNKIRILFNKAHAYPTDWSIAIDLSGDGSWRTISNNLSVPADGEINIYRDTAGLPTSPGDWKTTPSRWTEDFDNHVKVYGIRVSINTVNKGYGRPAIMELSPRLEADVSGLTNSWSLSESAAESDFINPIGTASANTGSVKLSNTTQIFNEQKSASIFYGMMDEEVNFRAFLKYGQDKIQMFDMLSDSWGNDGQAETTVELVDYARVLQNTKCNDMLLSGVSVGQAFHSMFASLGLKQFDIKQSKIKETPVLEKFYTKREQSVWEVIQAVCKGLQLSAVFNHLGELELFTKEGLYNTETSPVVEFISSDKTDQFSDIMSLSRSENAKFNKVTIKYKAVNDFSLSGGKNQMLWQAPDTWSIGAAHIIKDIYAGDNYFIIDPNRPEALPRYSGTVLIDGLSNEFKWKGKQFDCFNATSNRRVKVENASDYLRAIENNNGEAPRFTGRIWLDDQVFHRNFRAKNYEFRQEWDIIEYSEGSPDGVRMPNGKHSPVDGAVEVKTSYSGGKRLNIFKRTKNWNRYDRIGMKFKAKNNSSRVGIVVWPQGKNGASGYYFVADPMGDKEYGKLVASNEEDNDASKAVFPEVHGFAINSAGNRVALQFDNAKNYKDIPPMRVDRWNYMEVQVYSEPSGFKFEVYINGEYCKTFTGSAPNIQRNENGGMTFMGSGTVLIDKFYVVNYPEDAIRDKDKDDGGWVVHRKDLWTNRKVSSGDRAFNNYLKSVNRKKRTKLYDYDFSGRFCAVAREKVVMKVRFENPASTAEMKMTNRAVHVHNFEPSAFGARFTLINHSEKNQILKGTIRTRVSGADREFAAYIFGRSFRQESEQEIEYKDSEMIDRYGPLPIEFDSEWIQSSDVADDLAKWVKSRFGKNAEVYEMEVFGNPLVRVGDVACIDWPEKGFVGRNRGKNYPDSKLASQKWVIIAIDSEWVSGLTTKLTLRKII